MNTICAVLPCGAAALPDQVPHLCGEHRDLEICPTCEYWPWGRRKWCKTCHGRTFVADRTAAVAVGNYARWESWERVDVPLEERDTRWRSSSRYGVWTGRAPIDAPDPDPATEAPGSPVDETEGEGGYYPPDVGAISPATRGPR